MGRMRRHSLSWRGCQVNPLVRFLCNSWVRILSNLVALIPSQSRHLMSAKWQKSQWVLATVTLSVKLFVLSLSKRLRATFKIGHDGVLSAQGWYVKNVEIDMPQSGKNYYFPCGRWLAKDKDDGLLVRTISVMDASSTVYKASKYFQWRPHEKCRSSIFPVCSIFFIAERSYELMVETGDRESAGTDCRITLQFFGAKGAASSITLSKQEDNFERANKDLFNVSSSI